MLAGKYAASGPQALWHKVGRQLRHPVGLSGRVAGHCMAIVNRTPNRLAINALAIAPGDNVLELGFGPGCAIGDLARRAGHGRVWGVDQSAEMLTQASRRNRREISRGRVSLRMADMADLPFSDGTFEKVLGVNVAYFFHADGRELLEARRVLKRGGRMCLYMTDRSTLAQWKFATDNTHRSFTLNEFYQLARSVGFSGPDLTIVPMLLPLGVSGFLAIMQKAVA